MLTLVDAENFQIKCHSLAAAITPCCQLRPTTLECPQTLASTRVLIGSLECSQTLASTRVLIASLECPQTLASTRVLIGSLECPQTLASTRVLIDLTALVISVVMESYSYQNKCHIFTAYNIITQNILRAVPSRVTTEIIHEAIMK